MPIIETPIPGTPLTQGDVLTGVPLFVSAGTGDGPARKAPHKMCMVVSRPCVVGHKPNVVVAAVEKMADSVPRDVETFDEILRFLKRLRDAPDSPDIYYLGQIPGFEGRFAARLDSLHTVELPQDAPGQESAIASRRVARLNDDFLRDLHTRLFRAFSTLGFDDHRWMSTPDLRWLVTRGRQEMHDARSAVEGARTALASAQARGFRNDGERKQLEKAVTDAQKKLDDLTPALALFEAELASREPPAG